MNVAMLSYNSFHQKGVFVIEGFHASFRRNVKDALQMLLATGYHVSDDPYRDGSMTTYMFDYAAPMNPVPALVEAELVEVSEKATLYCFDDGSGTFDSVGMNLEYVGDREVMFDSLAAVGWNIYKPADSNYRPVKGETVYHLFREREG